MRAPALTILALAAALLALLPGAGRAAETLAVPAVTIYPGDTITDAMLADQSFPNGTSVQFRIVGERADLVGKVARRTLPAGRLIAVNAVGVADVVSRGTIVRAVYKANGLTIETPVMALQSGALNALIQVRNIDSGKVIIGSVQADGTVRIDR